MPRNISGTPDLRGFTQKFTELGAHNPAPDSPGSASGELRSRLSQSGPLGLRTSSPSPPARLDGMTNSRAVTGNSPPFEKDILTPANKLVIFVEGMGEKLKTSAVLEGLKDEVLKAHYLNKIEQANKGFKALEVRLTPTQQHPYSTGANPYPNRYETNYLLRQINKQLESPDILPGQCLHIALSVTESMGKEPADLTKALKTAVIELDARKAEKRILSSAQKVLEFIQTEGRRPKDPRGDPADTVLLETTLNAAEGGRFQA